MVAMHTSNGKSHFARITDVHFMMFDQEEHTYLPVCGERDWSWGASDPDMVSCKECLKSEEYKNARSNRNR